jgi:hypothetical protein
LTFDGDGDGDVAYFVPPVKRESRRGCARFHDDFVDVVLPRSSNGHVAVAVAVNDHVNVNVFVHVYARRWQA